MGKPAATRSIVAVRISAVFLGSLVAVGCAGSNPSSPASTNRATVEPTPFRHGATNMQAAPPVPDSQNPLVTVDGGSSH